MRPFWPQPGILRAGVLGTVSGSYGSFQSPETTVTPSKALINFPSPAHIDTIHIDSKFRNHVHFMAAAPFHPRRPLPRRRQRDSVPPHPSKTQPKMPPDPPLRGPQIKRMPQLRRDRRTNQPPGMGPLLVNAPPLLARRRHHPHPLDPLLHSRASRASYLPPHQRHPPIRNRSPPPSQDSLRRLPQLSRHGIRALAHEP